MVPDSSRVVKRGSFFIYLQNNFKKNPYRAGYFSDSVV